MTLRFNAEQGASLGLPLRTCETSRRYRLPGGRRNYWFYQEEMERAKRIELSTSTLARWRSTAELRPLICIQSGEPAGEGGLIDGGRKPWQGPFERFL